MKTKLYLAACLIGLFCLKGCVPLLIGGAAAGAAGSGTYLYINGELLVEYNVSFDTLRNACETVVAEMGGREVVPVWKIGEGSINALIKGESVKIRLEYKSRETTLLAIRIGYFGNKTSAQLIKDNITEYLLNNQ
ncbi:MAG: DUF3568 domain-containing protein [Syntrophobacterales bacterium]|jgi:hypothetical protein|nr:DUF3568 domain-containing protein [Syntrophobacterales bacterium]